jgi:hypothetical protein
VGEGRRGGDKRAEKFKFTGRDVRATYYPFTDGILKERTLLAQKQVYFVVGRAKMTPNNSRGFKCSMIAQQHRPRH